MTFYLPENVRKIIETLENSGYKAYVVGGCVRDTLLGVTPDDYDICTSATPDEITALFDNTAATGAAHGTITVIINKTPFEVTTFRTDGEYKDSRHPEDVRFVGDVKDDLARRDFTVNAMCYNEKDGLTDCFGGLDDLNAGILRAVGDPDARFKEDALRILRLFRFASALGFDIEKSTLAAAKGNANLLKNVSRERIREELIKLACGQKPEAILPLIKTGALPMRENALTAKISLLPQKKELRFFALLLFTCEDAQVAAQDLKCSNGFKNYCKNIQAALLMENKTPADIKRLLRLLENDVFDLFSLENILFGEDTRGAADTAKRILETGEPYKISHLKIGGGDIAEKGYSGEEIGKKLSELLERVIEDPKLNRKETLAKLI